jgi:mRNA interferase RelE/StbE
MIPYRLDIPPHVAKVLRHLHPDLKRALKAALRAIAQNPEIGTPLERELAGLSKYRVRRFRIAYAVDRAHRVVRLMAVGHRRRIYDELTEMVGVKKRPPK